jgi:hypothetical protein
MIRQLELKRRNQTGLFLLMVLEYNTLCLLRRNSPSRLAYFYPLNLLNKLNFAVMLTTKPFTPLADLQRLPLLLRL